MTRLLCASSMNEDRANEDLLALSVKRRKPDTVPICRWAMPSSIGANHPLWLANRRSTAYWPSHSATTASAGWRAASFAAKPRGDIRVGARVFHEKFGYGVVASQEGNKLEIDFETAERKRVIDSFVKLAE